MANNEHRIMTLLLNDNKGVYTVGQVNTVVRQSKKICATDNKVEGLNIEFWMQKADRLKTEYTAKYGANTRPSGEMQTLQNGTNDITSANWINAKNKVNEYVAFIWGSLDGGGFGVMKNGDNTQYCFFSCSGYYTNGTSYRYWLGYSWAGFITTQIQNIIVNYKYNGDKYSTTGSYGDITIAVTYTPNTGIRITNAVITNPLTEYWSYDWNTYTTVQTAAGALQGNTDWVKQNIASSEYIPEHAVWVDDVYTNGDYPQNVRIHDDIHEQLANWVWIQGHWFGMDVDPDENDGGGLNPPQGGGGKWKTTNKPVKPTDVSGIEYDAFNSGFIHAYNPTAAELHQLATFLFSGITKNIANMLKKLMANPMDYIVGLNMCHFNVSCTSADSVKFGGVDTNVIMNVIDKQIVAMNGGSVTLEENAGGMLDYAPNTRVKIYIPYCGVHELPIDLVMGGTLKLQYIVDVLTGSLVAELSLIRDRSWLMGSEDAVTQGTGYDDGGLMWSYSGNCFIPIPIASTDYRNVVNGALGLVSGIGTSIATGNPLPLAGSVAGAVMNSKPQIQVGSNMGANYGYMTAQDAYLIIEQPVPAKPMEYQSWVGYPVNEMYTIRDYSGLMIVKTDNYWCGTVKNGFGVITPDEADELRELLNGGICV